MTEETKPEVININGTEYDINSLKDKEKYFVAQLQDLQGKKQNMQFQLDQVVVAEDFFSKELMASLETTDEEVEEAEVVDE